MTGSAARQSTGTAARRRTPRRLAAALAGLVRACHAEPTAAVTAVAAVLTITLHRPIGDLAKVTAAVLASQLCVGWSNDWLDAPRDALVGRADKPIARGAVPRRVVGVAAVLAGLATLALSPRSGWHAAVALDLGLAAGLLYDWPLKFTLLSPLPYLVGFGALAAFVALGRPGRLGRFDALPWWLVVAAALLGCGAHFLNVLPDLADDALTQVRGLPQRLGAGGSWLAGGLLLLAATLTLVLGPPGTPTWAGAVVLAIAATVLPAAWYISRKAGSRAAFRAVMLVALADVVLLLVSGTAA